MTTQIDTTAVNQGVRLVDRGTHPSAPASGFKSLYVISGSPHGGLYVEDNGGRLIGPFITGTATVAGSGDLVFLEEISPTGATGTFSNISQSYSKIAIEYIARSTQAAAVTSMSVWVNQDYTAANYRSIRGFTYAAGTVGGNGAADSIIDDIAGDSAPANSCTVGTIQLGFYKATTFNKQIRGDSSHRRDDATVFEIRFYTAVEWENTAAINRLDFTLGGNNFKAGSTFRLYGVT